MITRPAAQLGWLRQLARMVDWKAAPGRTSAVSISDLRAAAQRRLPRMIFDYIDGGAGSETTLRANTDDFRRVTLRPRVFVGVEEADTSTTVCGIDVSLPVILAPTGMPRLARRAGELGAADAAAHAGTIFTVGTAASYPLESIAEQAAGPLWFQLYLGTDADATRDLVRRVRNSGYRALVVTADVPAGGQRLRDLRNGLTIPPRITLRGAAETVRHPGWLWDITQPPEVGFANFRDNVRNQSQREYARRLYSPTSTWDDIARLREHWPGTLIVKGVLTGQAALCARNAGADAVVVSNHGGRQLDGVPSSISALPEVVAAVGASMEVLVDGGIRTGPDIAKAIAMGARAALVGRPWLWALAAGGVDGVRHCLEILREDLHRSMQMLGVPTLAELSGEHVCVPRDWLP